ncbi:MAG: pseudouridine-5'-phosphate glycosidase [Spirochaetia bacterium]
MKRKEETYLRISPEVRTALEEGKPVTALESTIISHGMPYPENIQNARTLEKRVREAGSVPATIALREGHILIGLSEEDLEYFGSSGDIGKASRRDIPAVLAKGLPAATTVSATMMCADLIGIRVFSTGGIGGVHRGAEDTFDISADLQELARTSVAVVCSGAKAILDIPRTLEYLETIGVPVLGYGTDELPAFYTRESGLKTDYRVDSPEETAAVMSAKWNLGFSGGILIANPIPEEASMERKRIDGAIDSALAEARRWGITGKELTPFLLDKIKELTGGESLTANRRLAEHNAELAGRIAAAYAINGR